MKKSDRNNQILDAACTLFALEGYDSVSVRKIAQNCDCSPALIIKMFGSKESIYETLFLEWKQMTLEPMITKVMNGNTISALEYVFNLISSGEDERKPYRDNLSEAVTTRLSYREQINQVMAKQQDIENDIILPLLERAKLEGVLVNVDNMDVLARIFLDAAVGARTIHNAFPLLKQPSFSDVKRYIMKL